MKIKLYCIIIIIGTISLTSFVFAQSEVAPTNPPACKACSSGSPIMKLYMTMVSDIITALWLVSNNDKWSIAGQWYNIETKNKWSRERASNTTNPAINITNQSRGIKSDMSALNKAHQRIIDAGIIIINTKFQYNQPIEAKVMSAITASLNKQVWSNKLFITQGSITSSDYSDLLLSLIQLHQYISKIPTAESWYSFTWQWYKSNPVTISEFVLYYSCAQNILTCNSNTSLLKQTGISIKWYWTDIMRAMTSIKEVMSSSYRSTSTKRSGNIINFGGDLVNLWSNTKEQWSSFMWEWKQRNKDRRAKRAAKEEQDKAQAEVLKSIKWAQAAASQWWIVLIEDTVAQPTVTTSSPSYKQWEISILAAALNAATDNNLSQRVEAQRYTITNNSTIIAYKIPRLTRQIFDTSQIIKTSANTIINMCKKHCANVEWYCGEEIK